MKKTLIFALFFLLALMSSCMKESAPCDDKIVRVLSIGNSFTLDAFSYAPILFNANSKEVKLDFDILYSGGKTLKDFVEIIRSDTLFHAIYHYDCTSDRWTSREGAFSSYDFGTKVDYIVVNQLSCDAPFYETYQPYLNQLIGIFQKYYPDAVFLYLQTPPRILQRQSQQELFKLINESCKKVLDSTVIAGVIPFGTSIQNARQTELAYLSDGPDMTRIDSLHLQDGGPKLVSGYACSQYFFSLLEPESDILNDSTVIDDDFMTRHNPPRYGDRIVVLDEKRVNIAKKCAIESVINPYGLYEK